MAKTDQNKKSIGSSSRTIILGLVIILISIVAFVINQTSLVSTNTALETSNDTLVHKVDTLTHKIDSVEKEFRDYSATLAAVSNFYKYRNYRQLDSFMMMFSDTIGKYYRMDTVSKNVIKKDMAYYWKRHPEERYFLDAQRITVAHISDNDREARVSLYYTRNAKDLVTVTSVFRFNADGKIYYVRDLNATAE